ncbi:MAG: protein kinase [Candidatus Riflebacteria bacterium]|nr:protein kinase [Candidatus Riflebacteria bacterium]
MIGEIINDKYKIESVFSESYMYEIFTAIEAATGQTVVLKLMKEEMAVSAERVRVFSEEIKNFASLSHPNIAEILDLDMFEDRPYVVSPLISGKELNFVMKEEVLSLPDSVKIIQDLAAVLQCAADHKIENRNINLSNVIRKKDGHVTVLSFTLPRLKLITANPVKRNENAGIQADLYFLGTALYELLAGKSPIRKIGGLHELWDMNLEKELRIRHPELEPSHQRKIVDFIRKTLTREMNQRFNSYEEFLKAIADLAGDFRQANIRNKVSRQMSMASHIVDVLNNKFNSTTTIVGTGASEDVKISKSSASATVLKAVDAKPSKEQQTGYAEECVDGNLALSIQGEDLSEEENGNAELVSPKSAPYLKLVKNTKTVKKVKKQTNEWAEEKNIMKSPVVIIGFILAIMVLLILFW